MAQRRTAASVGAVFGPATSSIQTGRDTGPLDVPEQRGAPGSPTAAARRANNTGLPDSLKTNVEQLSGLAMDDVRVHYNSPRPAQLQALAYTQGADIHVGPGQERHLSHEAWHVVQQKQGRVSATLQMKGVAINDDDALEREADRIGARAAQPGAFALSPGCGCATCANSSGVPGGGVHRIMPPPSRIGQALIIQKVKCPKCDTPIKSKQTECPGCGFKMPAKSASAAPSKSSEGAAPKAAKAAAGKSKPKEAKAAPTHSVRVQLQLVHPKVEMSEVVHHYDGTPITQEEAIGALNALLAKASVEVNVNGKKVVARAILTAAYQDVGPKVVTRIKQGAIAQSASTYFTTAAAENRIDVENMRGDGNFGAASAAGAAAPAAAAAAGVDG